MALTSLNSIKSRFLFKPFNKIDPFKQASIIGKNNRD
jgi:hypothetical protein